MKTYPSNNKRKIRKEEAHNPTLLRRALLPRGALALATTLLAFCMVAGTLLASRGLHSLFLKSEGSLHAIGWNSNGQLGDGTTTDRNSPVQIASSGVTQIAAGTYHSLLLKTDGSLWAMGKNSSGQLGDGTTTDRNSPVQIVASGVKQIAAGYYHSLFLKSDGSLWAMGQNSSGQLGDGTTIHRNTPVQVVASSVTQIAAGGYHNLLLKTDGSLWAMGQNSSGQLGVGTTIQRNSPIQVIPSGVTQIAAGTYHTLLLKTDGSLWAMGKNSSSQLGDGTTTNRTSPVQIVTSGVTQIATGSDHSLFLKSDGSLRIMGQNDKGQLGDGTTINRNSPVQVLASGVTQIAAGYHHTLFLKNDDSLWAMGRNDKGQLGDGTTTNRTSPVQVVSSGVLRLSDNAPATNAYEFTNATATGRTGPTQAQVNSAYSGGTLASDVTINTQGIQEWTVPATGTYQIEAWGASSGNSLGVEDFIGKGAKVVGSFNLTINSKIKILVGQRGASSATSGIVASGGGGGTFVLRSPYNSVASIMLVAGGGGAPESPSGTTPQGQHGQSNTSGSPSFAGNSQSTGGANGLGGGVQAVGNSGGGGGGFSGNGANALNGGGGGLSFLNGGIGGTALHNNIVGGFGGGGGSYGMAGGAGGGGGFSGGGGSDNAANARGGGGGSINAGTNQTNTAGTNTGHGKVIITFSQPAEIAPIITQGATPLAVTISEDGSPTAWVAPTLGATDADTADGSLTWSVSTAASNGTATVSGTGASPSTFTYAPNANFNGSDSFVAQVSDGDQNDTITVNVTVTSVNDVPVVANPLSDLSVTEDAANTTRGLGNVFNDADNTSITKTSTTSNALLVTAAVNGNTLTLDYQANQSGTATITVTGTSNGQSVSDAFTVTVAPVNDAPENLSLSGNEVIENKPSGTIVGSLSATDVDANATLAFSLVDGNGSADNARFTLNTSGTLKTSDSLDFEVGNSLSIRVRVTDNNDASQEKAFTISVSNVVEDLDGDAIEDAFDTDDDGDGFSDAEEVAYGSDPMDASSVANQAPSGIALDNSDLIENSPAGTKIGDFLVSDPDDPVDSGAYVVALVAGNGSTDNNFFTIGTDGSLQTAAVLDFETKTEHSIRVRVSDEHNASLEAVLAIRATNSYAPIVRTLPPAVDGNGTITLGGTVLTDGGSPVIEVGVLTSDNLRFESAVSLAASQSANFTVRPAPSALLPGARYYVRSFATNAEGTTFGAIKRFYTQEAESTPAPWWSDANESAGGWRNSDWFGTFIPYDNGWLYHADLGWLYAIDDGTSGLWVWKENLGWLWTAKGAFPHLYRNDTKEWLYFLTTKEGKTYLYNHATGAVE